MHSSGKMQIYTLLVVQCAQTIARESFFGKFTHVFMYVHKKVSVYVHKGKLYAHREKPPCVLCTQETTKTHLDQYERDLEGFFLWSKGLRGMNKTQKDNFSKNKKRKSGCTCDNVRE